MKLFSLTSLLALFSMVSNAVEDNKIYYVGSSRCITYTVTQGTGCEWMCSYCANQLQTNDYYFTDGVCVYKPNEGGCVGTPLQGVSYTCCAI